MIRTLQGTVSHHVKGGVILETYGIGYLVAVPLRALPSVGEETTLFVHHHIREDAQTLYGFQTLKELELFERLLDVSSIGPKSALAILSVASADEIAQAVETADEAFFTRVPGLGKKSALKILVELKGKFVVDLSDGPTANTDQELIEALESLGYAAKDLQRVMKELPLELTDLQSRLTWVLKHLSK